MLPVKGRMKMTVKATVAKRAAQAEKTTMKATRKPWTAAKRAAQAAKMRAYWKKQKRAATKAASYEAASTRQDSWTTPELLAREPELCELAFRLGLERIREFVIALDEALDKSSRVSENAAEGRDGG